MADIFELRRTPIRAIVVEPADFARTWRWHFRDAGGASLDTMSEAGDLRLVIDEAHRWGRKTGLPVMLHNLSGRLCALRRERGMS